jgi:hypothetical protein
MHITGCVCTEYIPEYMTDKLIFLPEDLSMYHGYTMTHDDYLNLDNCNIIINDDIAHEAAQKHKNIHDKLILIESKLNIKIAKPDDEFSAFLFKVDKTIYISNSDPTDKDDEYDRVEVFEFNEDPIDCNKLIRKLLCGKKAIRVLLSLERE